jgi:hypothetical protein
MLNEQIISNNSNGHANGLTVNNEQEHLFDRAEVIYFYLLISKTSIYLLNNLKDFKTRFTRDK